MFRFAQFVSAFLLLLAAATSASAGLLGTQVQGCYGLTCYPIPTTPQGFVTNTATVVDPGIEFIDPGEDFFIGSQHVQIPSGSVDFTDELLTLRKTGGFLLGNNFYHFALPNVTITNVTFVSGTLSLGTVPANPCDFPFFDTGFAICVMSPLEGMFMTFDAHGIWIEIDNWESLQSPGDSVEVFRVTTAEIPEPPTFLLVGAGLLFCLIPASRAPVRAVG